MSTTKSPINIKREVTAESLGTILLKELDQLAREKCLDRDAVFSILEKAFENVTKITYGVSNDIRVHINRDNGHISVTRHRTVVSEIINPFTEIELLQAADLALGEEKIEKLPLPSFNRSLVQLIKRELMENILDMEREIQYNEFKDRVGQVISGVVKRIEGGDLIIDLGRTDAIILRDELIPRENYRLNDRIKAYIYSVIREERGPQIFLSRTHPGFLMKLFAQEVPEIYDGLIEIKAVARDPGSRAKVAIISREERSFDPIGACVGVRGCRVNAVGQELQGEKIDIIPWSADIAVFVVNAMTPAEVSKVIIEKKKSITVVVPDHQQSIAIGRKGQNVRLAHQLTGMNIEIKTETAEALQRNQLRQERTDLFMEKLDLDEIMAHFLVSEGFESIKELAETPVAELTALEGFTEEIAQELKERAEESVQEESKRLTKSFLESGGDQNIIDIEFPAKFLSCLIAYKIFTVQDLAELSLDELREVIGYPADQFDPLWGNLIIKARNL